jgi:putative oxygen-independent coproporphyrinogen III oxidase
MSDFQLKQLPPLSLYIHLPWCVKKCPYCDFNSHNMGNVLPEQEYINALILDLELSLPSIWGRSIQSVFIGGGTPSLFTPNGINQILTNVRNLTNLSPFAEITMEANPGTIDNNYIAGYANAGVNRISLGVQSFNDKYLKVLGRIHDAETAINAIKVAKESFAKVNIDIMYGLPNQTLDEALLDIEMAISFDPEHFSCYNLTIEKNTEFFNSPPKNLPDNDLCFDMQQKIVEKLKKHGYDRYEVSAYAKNDYECLHNLNYWQFGDYLGIGAGSHSKISFHDRIIRQVRQKQPQNYMKDVANSRLDKQSHLIEDKIITSNELPFEFMLNSLRLRHGIPTSLFVERTGLSLNKILPALNIATSKKLINTYGNNIVPTELGYDFLNDLVEMFL